MQDISTKVDNLPSSSTGVLTASEFNNILNDLENFITSTSQTLSGADLYQFAKACATYAVTGEFFLDSGVVNTYTLSLPGSRRAPGSYIDGMRVRFYAGNTNTGASIVNVASLGTKDIVRLDGSALEAGDIQAGAEVDLTYRSASDYFILSNTVKVIGDQTIFDKKTFDEVPASGEDPSVGDDLVRLSYLQTYVTSAIPQAIPSGAMVPYTGSSAPTGWLLAYGQAVSRTTYSDLFAVFGTTYGAGDGSTTFNLPDLRGRTIFGKDNMGGSAANRITLNGTVMGGTGGSEYHTLITDEIPAHTHSYTFHSASGSGMTENGSGNGNLSSTTGSTGGGSQHNNMPPYMLSNFIVKI